MSVLIPLSKGQVAEVCDCCAWKVIGYKWHARWNAPTKSFYAQRNSWVNGAKGKQIQMHRVIANTPDELIAHHKDHNTLHNSCSNLENMSDTKNKQLKSKFGKSSCFIGVTWDKAKNRWAASIQIQGKRIALGRFGVESDAARSYDIAARHYFGEDCALNFPEKT